MAFLRNIPAAAADIFVQHLKTMDSIRNRFAVPIGSTQGQMSEMESGYHTAVTDARNASVKKLEELENLVNQNDALVRAEVEHAIGLSEEPAGVNEKLLREQKMMNAWARIKPALDKIRDDGLFMEAPAKISNFVLAFTASSDREALAALRRELPYYVDARLDDLEADGVKRTVIKAFEDTLASELPEIQVFLTLKRELDNYGVANARLAISFCKQAIQNGEMTYMTPLWGSSTNAPIVTAQGLVLETGGF